MQSDKITCDLSPPRERRYDDACGTALAQGVATRKAPPVLVKLEAGGGKVLSGRPLNRIDTLTGSGGHREYRWLVLAPEGTRAVTIEATSPKAGTARQEIALPGR